MTITRLLTITLLLGCLLPFGCSDKPTGSGDDDPAVVWTLGSEEVYTVTGSESQTVYDYITGLDFRFPDGGEGDLVVTELLSGPEAPEDGFGFAVEFTGASPIEIMVEPYEDDEQVMLMVYGSMPACYDDEEAANDRWLAIPPSDTLDGQVVFALDETYGAAGARPKVGARTFKYHWMSRLSATSTDFDMRQAIRWQSGDFITQFVDDLPESLKSRVDNDVTGRLSVRYDWDGLYYSGFWWRSLGSAGRLVKPTLHFKPSSGANSVAHETGHYLVHTLVGDDVQSVLEGQGNILYDHEVGDDNQRAKLLEEYAYFLEYYFTGSVATYSPENPYTIWGGLELSPSNQDIPGREGFGLLMLSGLTRTGATVQSLANPAVNLAIPELGLPFSKAFEIIAMGATDIKGLRTRIQSSLSAEENLKYQVIMERSGWQYGITGKLVGKDGNPVQDVTVSNVLTAGGTKYAGGVSHVPTGSDGKFNLTGEVFPGQSQLQCVAGSDTALVTINVDWDQPTNSKVDAGTLTVDFDNLLAQLQAKTHIVVSITGEHYLTSGIPMSYGPEFSPTGVRPTWTGAGFSAIDTALGSSWSEERKLTGTVSANGRSLISATYTYQWREHNDPPRNSLMNLEVDTEIIVTNVDFTGEYYDALLFQLRGPETGGHVSLKYKRVSEWEIDGEPSTSTEEYDYTNWNSTVSPASASVYFDW